MLCDPGSGAYVPHTVTTDEAAAVWSDTAAGTPGLTGMGLTDMGSLGMMTMPTPNDDGLTGRRHWIEMMLWAMPPERRQAVDVAVWSAVFQVATGGRSGVGLHQAS